jgi:hypothetical protein
MKIRKKQAQNNSLRDHHKNNIKNNKNNNNILIYNNNNVKKYINLDHLLYSIKLTKINYKKTNKSGIINHTKILLVQFQVIIWIKWPIIKISKIKQEWLINLFKSLLSSVKLKKLLKIIKRLKNKWLI